MEGRLQAFIEACQTQQLAHQASVEAPLDRIEVLLQRTLPHARVRSAVLQAL